VGLTVVALLLWRYSAAVRRYTLYGEAVADRRLEAAHAALWKWVAVFLVAHLLYAVVTLVARVPL
jgi:hypothetical protein